MALFLPGNSECTICGEIISAEDEMVGFPHFIPEGHRLWMHSDSCMHKKCWETWESRPEFVSLYNETVGKKVWGNGTRHVLHDSGHIETIYE